MNIKNRQSDDYYTVSAFAARVCVSKSTVYAWIHNGLLPALRIGKLYLIPREEADRWIKENTYYAC